jgi:hypothetical protein
LRRAKPSKVPPKMHTALVSAISNELIDAA